MSAVAGTRRSCCRHREKEEKGEGEGSMKRVVIGYVGWHCSPTGTDLAMIRKGVLRWRKSSLSVCGYLCVLLSTLFECE